MSLEKQQAAALERVTAIAKEVLNAQKQASEGRANYLRELVLATQLELGENPRQRAVEIGTLKEEERDEQLKALEAVNARFYAIVVRIAKDKIEGPDRGGMQLQRRTGFARSSMSTCRKWVRAGKDITGVVASRVTKRMLMVPGRRKGPSVKVLGNQARRYGTSLEATLATFAHADADAAREEWMRLKVRMERIFARAGKVRLVHTERRVGT